MLGGVRGEIWAPLLTLQPREEAVLRKRGVDEENSSTHPHPKNACGSHEALLGLVLSPGGNPAKVSLPQGSSKPGSNCGHCPGERAHHSPLIPTLLSG